MTPYPQGAAAMENPSLLVSDDGNVLRTPQGVVNPLVLPPGLPAYNSDPDLVYDTRFDQLVMTYRLVTDGFNIIRVKTSSDGSNWSFGHAAFRAARSLSGFAHGRAGAQWTSGHDLVRGRGAPGVHHDILAGDGTAGPGHGYLTRCHHVGTVAAHRPRTAWLRDLAHEGALYPEPRRVCRAVCRFPRRRRNVQQRRHVHCAKRRRCALAVVLASGVAPRTSRLDRRRTVSWIIHLRCGHRLPARLVLGGGCFIQLAHRIRALQLQHAGVQASLALPARAQVQLDLSDAPPVRTTRIRWKSAP